MQQYRFPRKAWMLAGMMAMTLPANLLPGMAHAQQPYSSAMTKAMPGMAGTAGTGQAQPLKEKRVLTVTGGEDWDAMRGFGKDSGMVAMMTLMMVGGSGMEHMKMNMGPMKAGGVPMAGMNMGDMPMGASGAMNPSQGLPFTVTVTPNPPIVGDNTLDIAVTDASGKPVTGLKLAASVAMTTMDMGTTKPQVTAGQDGHYTTVVNFSMKGPWRVTLTGSAAGNKPAAAIRQALDFNVGSTQPWSPPTVPQASPPAGPQVTLSTPADKLKVGKNALEFTILDSTGKPVTGAKVTTAVAMTSMDMGTAHPQAREGKGGRYRTEVEFSMKGPWRVTLTVAPPDGKPFTKALDFNIP